MPLSDKFSGPKFVQLFGPVLRALHALGDSARPIEVTERVAADLKMSEEDLAETLDSGTPRFQNLVAWARFYLAKDGYIDSSRRGVWTLTDKGRAATNMTHAQALQVFKQQHAQFPRTARSNGTDVAEESEEARDVDNQPTGTEISYREEVLKVLQALPAPGFERFCQRLLRESDFQEVTVTGRSGDGGIDGIGILQVNALVSFKVLFQCKRYVGSVTPSQVRDFRGAMMGRADKGIIITTGTFTSEARKEAVRDGVPPIELVDGPKLITMLEDLELGLEPVKNYRVKHGFFEDFR